MKPVFQTTFGGPRGPMEERGNCFSACIASLLELTIEEVPTFVLEEDWHAAAQTWLGARGYWMLTLPWHGHGDWYNAVLYPFAGYHLLGGQSPRGEFGHSVVAHAGRIVHDPHPEGGEPALRPSHDEFPWELSVLVPRFK